MPTSKRTNPIYQAQDILSRRDHSEFEVRQKLKRKQFSASEIQTAIGWLYKHTLLDDQRFATRYIESILLTKPVGPRWLSAKLRQKGVDTGIIENALTQAFPENKEQELAAEAARRWQRSHPRKAEDKLKLQRFLQGRGFSFNAINSATDSVIA